MAAVPPLETVADDGAAGLAEDSDAGVPASDSGGSDSDSSRMRIRCAALEVELEHERRARATAESAAQSLRREVCHHAGLARAGLGRLRVAWRHEQRRSAAATLMMSHRLGLGHAAQPAPRSASAELRREMAVAARSVASLAQLPAVTIIQAATRGFLTRRLVNGAAPWAPSLIRAHDEVESSCIALAAAAAEPVAPSRRALPAHRELERYLGGLPRQRVEPRKVLQVVFSWLHRESDLYRVVPSGVTTPTQGFPRFGAEDMVISCLKSCGSFFTGSSRVRGSGGSGGGCGGGDRSRVGARRAQPTLHKSTSEPHPQDVPGLRQVRGGGQRHHDDPSRVSGVLFESNTSPTWPPFVQAQYSASSVAFTASAPWMARGLATSQSARGTPIAINATAYPRPHTSSKHTPHRSIMGISLVSPRQGVLARSETLSASRPKPPQTTRPKQLEQARPPFPQPHAPHLDSTEPAEATQLQLDASARAQARARRKAEAAEAATAAGKRQRGVALAQGRSHSNSLPRRLVHGQEDGTIGTVQPTLLVNSDLTPAAERERDHHRRYGDDSSPYHHPGLRKTPRTTHVPLLPSDGKIYTPRGPWRGYHDSHLSTPYSCEYLEIRGRPARGGCER